jgi:hypothetical protein
MATIRHYWWMYLAMIIAVFSWIGWMHERSDKIQRIEVLQQNLIQYEQGSTALKEDILLSVRRNKEILQGLIEAQRIGPRHTACDTKQILSDLRSGSVADHYPVEDRCNQ